MAAGVRPDLAVAPRVYDTARIDGCGQAGFQTSLAVGPGGTVGVATLAWTDSKSTCMTMNGPAEARVYDVCFAESAGGNTWKAVKLASEKYLSLTGVGLAYAPNGDAAVAWTGNAKGVAPATLRCGASNLLLANGAGGFFSPPKAIATTSQAKTIVPDQAASCIQDVCNQGDATGYWPALAYDKSGQPAVAFRDLHFGFATDDFASSDVEFAPGPGYAITTVDVARGGGSYARLAFSPAGDPAIVHYNGERDVQSNGIWLNRVDGGTQKWTAQKITGARAGEQLGFAISPKGLYALAFYDEASPRLAYLESANGTDWTAPADVDTDGITGQFPSLTFGPDGEPVIAYYRCRDYDPKDRSCDRDKDALLVARRAAGRWTVETVSAETGVFDGLYPSIGFSSGKAVIAYQTRSYDPSSMKSNFELHIARER